MQRFYFSYVRSLTLFSFPPAACKPAPMTCSGFVALLLFRIIEQITLHNVVAPISFTEVISYRC